jgi:hypothetical protein
VKTRWIILGVLLLRAPVAGSMIVDQCNDSMVAGGYYSIKNYTPIGQEFRPTFDRIEVAEMYVSFVGFEGEASELLVEVYADSVFGTPLSVSSVVPVAADYTGPLKFKFPESVPLTPGSLYVLVIRELHGVNWGMRATGDLYPGGQMIRRGERVWYSDAWFREGTFSSPVLGSTWSRVKTLLQE